MLYFFSLSIPILNNFFSCVCFCLVPSLNTCLISCAYSPVRSERLSSSHEAFSTSRIWLNLTECIVCWHTKILWTLSRIFPSHSFFTCIELWICVIIFSNDKCVSKFIYLLRFVHTFICFAILHLLYQLQFSYVSYVICVV